MESFAYIAVDSAGARVNGSLEAEARDAALRQLRDRGLTPVSVTAVQAGRSTGGKVRPLSRRSSEDFCRELANLLAAGLPMGRSLGILMKQAHGSSLPVIRSIHEQVTGGVSLAEAMAFNRGSFTDVQVAMVRAGETGGFLHVVLEQIADFQSRERDLKGRVAAALAYPTILVAVSVSVLTFLLTFFIPKFTKMFTSLGGELPALTQAVVAISGVMVRHGVTALVVIVIAVLLLRRLLQTEAGRLRRDRTILALPLIGTITARLALVRFCRMLGTLIAAGVPLVASLRVAKQALGNRVLAEAIGQTSEAVVRGQSLSSSLRNCQRLFPLTVLETLAVSEEAGLVDKELLRLADVHERELDRRIRMAVALAEPALLFVMAAFVGTVVISMLLPIFSLQELIH